MEEGSEEVERELRCEEGDTEGLVVDWKAVEMELGNTVMMVNMDMNCPSHLGEDEENLIGFGQRVKFEKAAVACLALGGSQEVPSGEKEVVGISERFGDFKEDCHNKFWVPVRQEQGRSVKH